MIVQPVIPTLSNTSFHQPNPENSKAGKNYIDQIRNEVDAILDSINQENYHQGINSKLPDNEFSHTLKPIDQSKILSWVENKQQSDQKAFWLNSRSLTPIAEWEGYIEQITEKEFFVKMVNINTNESMLVDLATFSINDVSEHDLKLLKEGAYVRFVLGRERLPSGQIRNVSHLYFRRLSHHSEKGLDRANQKAKDLLDSINWID